MALAAPGTCADMPVSSCGADCAALGASQPVFRACLRAIPGVEAGTSRLVFPEDGEAAEAARRVFNSRFLRFPAATFYAGDAAEVAAAVDCARLWGVKVSPAAGRHNFEGSAVQDGYLTIDVTGLTQARCAGHLSLAPIGGARTQLQARLERLLPPCKHTHPRLTRRRSSSALTRRL